MSAVARPMPAQRPGKSRQDYGTPRDFIDAVERRFGPLDVDLACTGSENAKATLFIREVENSLDLSWGEYWPNKILWLNPPFGHIAPWAKKCALESQKLGPKGRILLLTPASVGSAWFERHVFRKALVLPLVGRLTFDGQIDPYPKDCMPSAVYTADGMQSFALWRWK